MLDLFHTTTPDNTKVYYTNGSGSFNWQTWTKPNNCKTVQIYTVGAGAGGGYGWSRGNDGAGGGGGGGASTSAMGIFPATVLPDTLYIQVGAGGRGGDYPTLTGATNGSISYICTQPTTASAYIVLASGNTPPTLGGPGGPSSAGAVGTAGAVFTTAGKFTSFYGDIQTIGATAATAGGTGGTTMTSVTVTNVTGMGGRGGAGQSLGGLLDIPGSVTGVGVIPTIPGGQSSTSGSGTAGSSGVTLSSPADLISRKFPFYATAGTGGGASSAATSGSNGGNGGNGSWGCGGGGGGASRTGALAVGGNGGAGGNGFVIIVSA